MSILPLIRRPGGWEVYLSLSLSLIYMYAKQTLPCVMGRTFGDEVENMFMFSGVLSPKYVIKITI